ncbi:MULTISPECIES: hypothetical protein [Giesbergeria]|uniref:Tail fiber assembly protein n=1 Tax=Giesbergeria sinuosa TaxID=80883 RepID=A0ABV9QD20_9BURK
MRYAIVNNGFVVNVVESDEFHAAECRWIPSGTASIGDIYDGSKFTKPTKSVLFADLVEAARAALFNEYNARVQTLASGYSQYERESWPIQTAEATAYTTDPQAVTPWLDAASAARGIDKAELAARVLTMDTAYRQIHGALTGHRQKLWDQIAVAQTAEDIAAIDVTVGWPALKRSF